MACVCMCMHTFAIVMAINIVNFKISVMHTLLWTHGYLTMYDGVMHVNMHTHTHAHTMHKHTLMHAHTFMHIYICVATA